MPSTVADAAAWAPPIEFKHVIATSLTSLWPLRCGLRGARRPIVKNVEQRSDAIRPCPGTCAASGQRLCIWIIVCVSSRQWGLCRCSARFRPSAAARRASHCAATHPRPAHTPIECPSVLYAERGLAVGCSHGRASSFSVLPSLVTSLCPSPAAEHVPLLQVYEAPRDSVTHSAHALPGANQSLPFQGAFQEQSH